MEFKRQFLKFGPWTFMIVAIIFIIAGFGFLVRDYHHSENVEKEDQVVYDLRGKMGDFYGGHLAAFSGLAASMFMLAGLIFQMQELQLMREENKESRDIFTAQKDIQAKQVELMEDAYEKEFILNLVRALQSLVIDYYQIPIYDRQLYPRESYRRLLEYLAVFLINSKHPESYYGLINSCVYDNKMHDSFLTGFDINLYPNLSTLLKKLEEKSAKNRGRS